MEEHRQVSVYIYDLTSGLAASLSPLLLGKHLEGVWHTGIVAYGREYFFGSSGIQSCAPGGTILGEPVRVERLGETEVPYQLFLEYIFGLGESTFAVGTYDLLRHNCNTFSDEVGAFLCGRGLPSYILALPDEIINTPLGQTIAPLLSALSLKSPSVLSRAATTTSDATTSDATTAPPRTTSPDLDELARTADSIRENGNQNCPDTTTDTTTDTTNGDHNSSQAEPRVSLANSQASVSTMPDQTVAASATNDPPINDTDNTADETVEQKTRVSPIVFKDAVADVSEELNSLTSCLDETWLTAERQQNLSELRQFLVDGEGAWALGDNFVSFIGGILHGDNATSVCRAHLLRLMAVSCLRDDFILVLHQDRREHVFMNYANKVDLLSEEEQMALTLAFANMFEQSNCSEWLLYISEWQSGGGTTGSSTLSNIRITTKVAVNALLSEHNSFLQEAGTAIMYNLAVKEKLSINMTLRQAMPAGSLNRVFDDVSTELAMAVLQYFQNSPPEELVFRCLTALSRFSQVSYNDVPQLIKMIGPQPDKFAGMSARCDKLVDQLESQLARVQS